MEDPYCSLESPANLLSNGRAICRHGQRYMAVRATKQGGTDDVLGDTHAEDRPPSRHRKSRAAHHGMVDIAVAVILTFSAFWAELPASAYSTSSPIQVSHGAVSSTSAQLRPSFDISGPYAASVWVDNREGSVETLFFAQSEDYGMSWTPERGIDSTSGTVGRTAIAYAEGSLTILYNTAEGILSSLQSRDGGVTWSKSTLPFTVQSFDMAVENQDLHLAWTTFEGTALRYSKASLAGDWIPEETVFSGSSVISPVYLAVSGGVVHVITGLGYAQRSIGTQEWHTNRSLSGIGIAAEDGYVHVVKRTNSRALAYFRSQDRGTSWSDADTDLTLSPFGSTDTAGLDATAGWIVVVASHLRESEPVVDVSYVTSEDHGQSWDPAEHMAFTTESYPYPNVRVGGSAFAVVWENGELFYQRFVRGTTSAIESGFVWILGILVVALVTAAVLVFVRRRTREPVPRRRGKSFGRKRKRPRP